MARGAPARSGRHLDGQSRHGARDGARLRVRRELRGRACARRRMHGREAARGEDPRVRRDLSAHRDAGGRASRLLRVRGRPARARAAAAPRGAACALRASGSTQGKPVLLTHAGVTNAEVEGARRRAARRRARRCARERACAEAVARVRGAWERGELAALDLEPLHFAGHSGREGGGLLYHRASPGGGRDRQRRARRAPEVSSARPAARARPGAADTAGTTSASRTSRAGSARRPRSAPAAGCARSPRASRASSTTRASCPRATTTRRSTSSTSR